MSPIIRERSFELCHNPFNTQNFSYYSYSGHSTLSYSFHFSFFPIRLTLSFLLLLLSSTFHPTGMTSWAKEVLLNRAFFFRPPSRPLHSSSNPPFARLRLRQHRRRCRPIASRLNGSFCFCFFRFMYAGLLKNFTLTFMLERNLRHGRWNFFNGTPRGLLGPSLRNFSRVYFITAK